MKRANLEGNRILMTGATGMFARPLVAALARSATVFAAARYRVWKDFDGIAALGATPIRIDVPDPTKLLRDPRCRLCCERRRRQDQRLDE